MIEIDLIEGIILLAALAVVAGATAYGVNRSAHEFYSKREDRDRAEIERLMARVTLQDKKIEGLELQVRTLTELVRAGGMNDPNAFSAMQRAG